MKRSKHPKHGSDLLATGRPLIKGDEVGDIFGVSRVTVLTWLKEGKIDHIGRVRLKGGWRYDMEDVFRAAYPLADNAELIRLMKEFREAKLAKRKAKRELRKARELRKDINLRGK